LNTWRFADVGHPAQAVVLIIGFQSRLILDKHELADFVVTVGGVAVVREDGFDAPAFGVVLIFRHLLERIGGKPQLASRRHKRNPCD
jgi:hypothetical protein